MFGRLLLILLLLFVTANIAVVVSGKNYLYKAVIYQKPGIDDLDIFDKREVAASTTPQAWPLASDYNQASLPPQTLSTLNQYQSVAYLIIKNGEVKQEHYWGGYNQNSLSNSFSAGKSIVSAGIGAAIQEGLIKSIDQRVSDFLPSFAEGKKATITIRDVLSMASGLSFEEAYAKPISDTTEAYYGNDLAALVNRLTVIEEPGKTWYYRSGDTQVLAMVLRAAVRKPIAEYISEKLWQPLGTVNSAYWNLDNSGGQEKAYCCFYSNARDFARIAQLYMNGGKHNGKQLVPANFVTQSITPHGLPDREGNKTNYYGFQWWSLQHRGHKIFYMRGILGQYVFAVPDLNMIIVRLGHKRADEKTDYYTPKEAFHYLDGAFDLYAEN